MAMPRLSDRAVAALKVERGKKDRLVFDALCPGLGVRVTAKGTRTFVAQWTDPATKQKVREVVGAFGNLTVEQAREAVRVRLGQVAKGVNPRAERLRQRAEAERERAETALTFEALVSEWAALHLVHRRPRYAAEAVRAIRLGLASLSKQPAARISKAEVVNALDQIAREGKAITAGRTMAYARAAFAWAEKRGKVSSNPFAGLPISAGVTERDRVLNDDELNRVWRAASALRYPFGPYFQLAILTLQRREEIASMRWSEISEDLTTWCLPAERMKNGRPHDVHLSEAARGIIRRTPRLQDSPFVLTTTGTTGVSGFSRAKSALDRQIAADGEGPPTPWRLHDLRRTGVSTLARLGFDSIVADLILAHSPSRLQGVARVYQRHNFADERARALEVWAAHVVGGEYGDRVVMMSKRAVWR
jgi:integrase